MKSAPEINWKNPIRNVHYIVIDDIPKEHRIPFMKFCLGRSCPVVRKEKDKAWSCYLISDYTEYLNTKGKSILSDTDKS
jgi:hypothetical protein